MNSRFNAQAKRILSKVLPDSTRLRYLSYLPKLDAFRKAHSELYPNFDDKFAMYDYVNDVVLAKSPITYIEFGVFKGKTIRYWAEINTCAESTFHGFDTFTGLPESWDNFRSSTAKNTFDAGGVPPQIDDQRISFEKGLFQDTLPGFLYGYSNTRQLVIHNDSDLYSSNLYVLTAAHSILVPGTVIIFDEFSSILHEFRALDDYCTAYRRTYEVIAAILSANDYFTQIAIRLH